MEPAKRDLRPALEGRLSSRMTMRVRIAQIVEKPMTRYLGEAFEIADTQKKTGKILQVGSQGCSDRKWHVAAEMIKAGKLGPLVLGQGSYMRNSPKGEWNYPIDDDAKPDNLNWNQWLGPVKHADTKEFNKDHYFRWRKYYPYCAGLLGDLFPHRLHPLMLFVLLLLALQLEQVVVDESLLRFR